MRKLRPLSFLAARLGRDRSGAAAVEMALVAPILIGIVLPMVDLGMGAFAKMRVQNSAEAGAQYALLHGYDATQITSAAQNATTLGANVAVTPSNGGYCLASGQIDLANPVAVGSPCADGTTAGNYVIVDTQMSYSLLISFPGLADIGIPNPMTLTGTAIVRIN
jgi:Flp pilus assembly protein TadG